MRLSKRNRSDEDKGFVSWLFSPLTWLFSTIFGWLKDRFYDLSVWGYGLISKRNSPKKQKTLTAKRKKEFAFFLCLVAYPLIQFLIFYVAVNINSILLAFQEYDAVKGFSYLGFDNLFKNFVDVYTDLGKDPLMITATKNSVILYTSTLLIAFPLNLIFSFFLYKKVPGHGFFRVILFLPQIISSLVVSQMFLYFVQEGITNLIGFNLLRDKATEFGTMVFYCIWVSFGTQILVYTSAMTKIDNSIVEYGELEGVSLFQEFWHITLPMIFPTITIFLVAGIAGFFTHQANLFNFYGTGARDPMKTLGYIFFVDVVKANDGNYYQYPYASAAGLMFTLVATPITLLLKWALEKYGPSVE